MNVASLAPNGGQSNARQPVNSAVDLTNETAALCTVEANAKVEDQDIICFENGDIEEIVLRESPNGMCAMFCRCFFVNYRNHLAFFIFLIVGHDFNFS